MLSQCNIPFSVREAKRVQRERERYYRHQDKEIASLWRLRFTGITITNTESDSMSKKPTKECNTYETHPDAPHLRYMTVYQDFESRSSITLHVWVPAEYEDVLKSITWHISMFKPEIIASVPEKSRIHKILSENGQRCTTAIELAHLLCILQYGKYGTVEYVTTTDDDNYDPRSTIIPKIIKDGKEVTTLGIR